MVAPPERSRSHEVRTPSDAWEVLRAARSDPEEPLERARLLCVERVPEELYQRAWTAGADLRSVALAGSFALRTEALPHLIVVGGTEPELRARVAERVSPLPLPVVFFEGLDGPDTPDRVRTVLALLARASRVDRWLRSSADHAEGVFEAAAIDLLSLPTWLRGARGRLDVTLFGRRETWAELLFEDHRLTRATVHHRRSREVRWEQGVWSWTRLLGELEPHRVVIQRGQGGASAKAPSSGVRRRVPERSEPPSVDGWEPAPPPDVTPARK